MRLTGLALRSFRNFTSQELDFPAEGVAIIGDNAQGKSNLLEAIYYLETFRSFRGASDEQLVRFGEEVFRVVGTLTGAPGGGTVEVSAAFDRRAHRKKVAVDRVEPSRLADALGRPAAVIFSPSDLDLVSGGPAERRRFLDILLSLSSPGYLEALQEYRRILARRNAALKAGEAVAVVAAWDPGLLRSGVQIMEARRIWIETHGKAFRDCYAAVSGGAGALLEYLPGVALRGAIGDEQVTVAFQEALSASADRERRMGSTLVGPHRDEVAVLLETEGAGLSLREFGSGGQRRTAALALRLAEARTVREVRRQEPILLLDDVFGELDEGRSERVLDLMEREDTGQVILTAPKEGDVRMRGGRLPRWRIEGGRICA